MHWLGASVDRSYHSLAGLFTFSQAREQGRGEWDKEEEGSNLMGKGPYPMWPRQASHLEMR